MVLAPGLPNITGFTNGLHAQPIAAQWSGEGALGLQQHVGNVGSADGNPDCATGVTFNAALSNSIYGASNTVQPPALQLIPQIRY